MKKRHKLMWVLLAVGLLLPQGGFAAARELPELAVTWLDGNYNIDPFHEGIAVISRNRAHGYINAHGEIVLPCEYSFAEPFSEGLGLVSRGGRHSFVDASGQEALRPSSSYSSVGSFSDGLAVVQKDGKYGYIDKTGALVIPLMYDGGGYFSEGLACVKEGAKWGYINKENEVVIPFQFDGGEKFSEGAAAVLTGINKYRFIDLTGERIAPFEFYKTQPFRDGVAEVTFAEGFATGYGVTSYTFIDRYLRRDGTLVSDRVEVWNFNHGPCLNEMDDPFNGHRALGYFDRDGKLISQVKSHSAVVQPFFLDRGVHFDYSPPFQNGYTLLTRDGRCTLVDETFAEIMVVSEEISSASMLFDGVAWVRDASRQRIGLVRLPEALTPPEGVSDWAKSDVRRASLLGLLTDRVQDGMTQPITRLQFAELSVRFAELAGGAPVTPVPPERFTDTRDEAALKAAGAGIVLGMEDGSVFRPDAPITREQIAVMLARTISAVEARGGTLAPTVTQEANLRTYDDSHEISPWAVSAMERLNALGIMQGVSEQTLAPGQDTSVQEAILLILRTYDAFSE